jgi:hypothetical protein
MFRGNPVDWRSPNGVDMNLARNSFPGPGSFNGAMFDAANVLNRNPSQFSLDMQNDSDGVALGNGENEVWFDTGVGAPGRANMWGRGTNSDSWMTEVDVRIDQTRGNWTSSSHRADIGAYDGMGSKVDSVILHELGHAASLMHETDTYNVMGDSWDMLHANGNFVRVYFGEDASRGLMDLYGSNEEFSDLSVAHWKRIGDDGEYSNHGRTEMRDSGGNELTNLNTNDAPRYRVTRGETVQVEFTYENLGTSTESFNVGIYASRSGVITTRDLLIREVPMTLSPDTAYTQSYSVTVPDTLLPDTDYAIGVIVDNRDTVSERRETNNASYIHVRTDSGDDPDAYTRWLGTYQGRIDGERARMKIERSSFAGFREDGYDVEIEFPDTGKVFDNPVDYDIGVAPQILEPDALIAADRTSIEIPRLLIHGFDRDYISGFKQNGERYGVGFVREGPKDSFVDSSERAFRFGRFKKDWEGTYVGRNDGRNAELTIKTAGLRARGFRLFQKFAVKLEDKDRNTTFTGQGHIAIPGNPSQRHEMEFFNPLTEVGGTGTKWLPRLRIHTGDRNFVSGNTIYNNSPFGLFFKRELFVYLGEPYLVIGSVQVSESQSDNTVTLSNLKAENDQGVSFDPNQKVSRFDLSLEPVDFGNGSEVSVELEGDTGGPLAARRNLGSATLSQTDDRMSLSADFSAIEPGGLRFEMFVGGDRVGVFDDTDIVHLLAEGGEPPQLLGVGALDGSETLFGPGAVYRFGNPVSMAADGAEPVVADEIRVFAKDTSAPSRGLARVNLVASNFPSLTIVGQSSAPVPAENSLFGLDPDAFAIAQQTETGDWVLFHKDLPEVDSGLPLINFGPDPEAAERGLRAIRHYGMSDFIRFSDSPLKFFLASGEAPRGSLEGEKFVEFDPASADVQQINESWQVSEGGQPIHPVLNFGPDRSAAENAVAEIRRYGFTRLVLVGGSEPEMTYFTAPDLPEAPDLVIADFALAGDSIVRIGERIGDRLSVTIRNQSESAAVPESLLGIFLSPDEPTPQSELAAMQMIGEAPIPFLAPGESVELSLDELVNIPDSQPQQGAALVAYADFAQAFTEQRENNNVASLPVGIMGAPGELGEWLSSHDLVAADLQRDPDGDGMLTLLEYFVGGDPRTSGALKLDPKVIEEGGERYFAVDVPTDRAGMPENVSATMRGSDDLGQFHDLNVDPPAVIDGPDGKNRLRFRQSNPIGEPGATPFMRLKVEEDRN